MPRVYPRRAWVIGIGALLLTACMSPTMPMPPPNRPEIEGPDESGVVWLSGHAPRESIVYAENLSNGYIRGDRTDAVTGAYRFDIRAAAGDAISMYYRRGVEVSMAIEFTIPTKAVQNTVGAAGAAGAAGGFGAGGVSGLGGALGVGSAGNDNVAGAVGAGGVSGTGAAQVEGAGASNGGTAGAANASGT